MVQEISYTTTFFFLNMRSCQQIYFSGLIHPPRGNFLGGLGGYKRCLISILSWAEWTSVSPSAHTLFRINHVCPTICDPMDCSPLAMGFSRPEYWSGLPSCRGSFPPRNQTQVSHIVGDSLPAELPGKPQFKAYISIQTYRDIPFYSLFIIDGLSDCF